MAASRRGRSETALAEVAALERTSQARSTSSCLRAACRQGCSRSQPTLNRPLLLLAACPAASALASKLCSRSQAASTHWQGFLTQDVLTDAILCGRRLLPPWLILCQLQLSPAAAPGFPHWPASSASCHIMLHWRHFPAVKNGMLLHLSGSSVHSVIVVLRRMI